MKVEIWLDYACQKSYKTHKNLHRALSKLNFKVEVLYRSYIVPSYEECIDKDIEQTIKMTNPLYKPLDSANTIYAHCLAHLAKKRGECIKINNAIFDAFYIYNRNINSLDVILEIAKEENIDIDLFKETLSEEKFKEAIQQNYINAIYKKIHTIPHIRINGKVNLSGYKKEEDILNTIIKEYNKINNKAICYGKDCKTLLK